MKDKLLRIRDFIVSHSKLVFPLLLIAVVAITVSVALGARENREGIPDVAALVQSLESESSSQEENTEEESTQEQDAVPDVPLEYNMYPEVNTLIYTYYDALANGNVEAVEGITNYLDDDAKFKIQELGKYIEWYPSVEIYTKPGPEENSYVVFACTRVKMNNYEEQIPGIQIFYACMDENGTMYLNEEDTSEETINYIYEMNFQADVVELHNQVTVEYNEIMAQNTELLAYLDSIEEEIKIARGLMLASQVAEGSETSSEEEDTEDPTNVENPDQGTTTDTETPVTSGPVYAMATATVNVRKSDSEAADRLGKISQGTRIEVLEQRQNGWSKVDYEGKEGFIKTEYLQFAESAADVQIIGSVKATTGINIRTAPEQSSARLGVLASGETLDLVEVLDGWCKVIYNGQIAYVNADYVTQQ